MGEHFDLYFAGTQNEDCESFMLKNNLFQWVHLSLGH